MSDEVTFTIYGLADPTTQRVRYVGRSSKIKARYQQHLKNPQGDRLKEWIDTLSANGQKPLMIILESASIDQAEACEQRWMDAMTEQHGTLLNVFKSTRVRRTLMYGAKSRNIRFPKRLYIEIETLARHKNRTVNSVVVDILTAFAEHEPYIKDLRKE
jgi:hypothetical protein